MPHPLLGTIVRVVEDILPAIIHVVHQTRFILMISDHGDQRDAWCDGGKGIVVASPVLIMRSLDQISHLDPRRRIRMRPVQAVHQRPRIIAPSVLHISDKHKGLKGIRRDDERVPIDLHPIT